MRLSLEHTSVCFPVLQRWCDSCTRLGHTPPPTWTMCEHCPSHLSQDKRQLTDALRLGLPVRGDILPTVPQPSRIQAQPKQLQSIRAVTGWTSNLRLPSLSPESPRSHKKHL